jgi:hypothetical protein
VCRDFFLRKGLVVANHIACPASVIRFVTKVELWCLWIEERSPCGPRGKPSM